MNNWIQTYTGKKFYPLDPNPEDVNIEDIAHSLSNTCRFRGHCNAYYSVAQHSVYVADLMPAGENIHGLLHDAAEAYLFDCPAPIKDSFPEIIKAEEKLIEVIYAGLGIVIPGTEIQTRVHDLDLRLLVTEQRDLMPNVPEKWSVKADPFGQHLVSLSPISAKKRFLEAWEEYKIRQLRSPMPLRDSKGYVIANNQTLKKQILEFLEDNKGADQLDVSVALEIGLEKANDLCLELVAEKRIEFIQDKK